MKKKERRRTPNNGRRPASIRGVAMVTGVDVTMDAVYKYEGSAVEARELGCALWRGDTC